MGDRGRYGYYENCFIESADGNLVVGGHWQLRASGLQVYLTKTAGGPACTDAFTHIKAVPFTIAVFYTIRLLNTRSGSVDSFTIHCWCSHFFQEKALNCPILRKSSTASV